MKTPLLVLAAHCHLIGALLFHGALWAQEVGAAETQLVEIEIGLGAIVPSARQWYINEAKAFDAARPDIKVSIVDDGQDLRPTTHIKDVPFIARNVIGIQAPINMEIHYLAARELIVPIEKFLPDPDFSRDVFYENAFTSVTLDQKTWGVPWFLDSLWLICDWELFEQEGIAEPPRTWSEFMDHAKRLTKDTNGDGKLDQYGVRFPAISTGMIASVLMTLGAQHGIEIFDGENVDLSHPKLAENFEFMRELLASGYVKVDTSMSFIAPTGSSEKFAMQFMHNSYQFAGWPNNSAPAVFANSKLRFAFLPTDANEATIVGERYYLCIRRSTPAQERASWEFLKWINRPDATFPNYWYGYPVRKDVVDRPEFKKWAESTCRDAYVPVEAMKWSRSSALPFDSNMYRLSLPYLTRILTGQVAASAELPRLEAELNNQRIQRPQKPDTSKLLE